MRILLIITILAFSFSTKSFSFTHDKIIRDLNKAAEQLNKDLNSNNAKDNSKPLSTPSSSKKANTINPSETKKITQNNNFEALNQKISSTNQITLIYCKVSLEREWTEDNDFNGNVISNASLLQVSDKVYNTGNISINSTIEWSDGSYQNVTVTSDVVLSLGNWPLSGTMGVMRLALRSDGVSRTVTLDAANAGSVFRNSSWPGGGTVTVASLTNPVFIDAWSSDGGATVFMEYKGSFSST